MRLIILASMLVMLCGCDQAVTADGNRKRALQPSARPDHKVDDNHCETTLLEGRTSTDATRVQFRIPNRTNGLLHVLDTVASCTCSSVSLDRDEVPPGETATLTVSTRLSGRPETRSIGCSVRTDNDRERTLSFSATFRVLSRLEGCESPLKLGKVTDGETIRKRFTVTARTPTEECPTPLRARLFGLPNSTITSVGHVDTVTNVSYSERTSEFELTILTDDLPDNGNADVIINSVEATSTTPLRLPLQWVKRHQITANPNVAIFSLSNLRTSDNRDVIIDCDSDAVELLSLRIESLPGVNAVLSEVDFRSSTVRISISLSEAVSKSTRYAGKVIIRYRAEVERDFAIPVVVLIANSQEVTTSPTIH